MVNCHWQDESIVIIGVFADQVHTPGRADDESRFGVKMGNELADDIFYIHRRCYTIEAAWTI
jgi:hypothetical protein